MKISLQKVRQEKFDDLASQISLDDFLNSNFERFLTGTSTYLEFIDSNLILQFDTQSYFEISKRDIDLKDKNKLIARLLHKDILASNIPRSHFLNKETWAFINMSIFPKIINFMYDLPNVKDKELLMDRFKRYILNDTTVSQISRSGFRFLWHLADTLYDNGEYNLLDVAFDFIDPVQKIIERKMGKNKNIVKAFVQGIINNKYDRKFTNKDLRNIIPTHISTIAQVNIIDRLSYNDLVNLITKEQKLLLGIYK